MKRGTLLAALMMIAITLAVVAQTKPLLTAKTPLQFITAQGRASTATTAPSIRG